LALPSQSYMYYEAHVVEGFLSAGIQGKYLCDYPRTLPSAGRGGSE